METVDGDNSEMGSVTKKEKITTGIGSSLTLDFRDKKERNNNDTTQHQLTISPSFVQYNMSDIINQYCKDTYY